MRPIACGPCRCQGVLLPGPAGNRNVHATRHQSGRGKVLVKLDFRNAFNTVSRQAALDTACRQFPPWARIVNWCYCAPADLYFGSRPLVFSRVTLLDPCSSRPPCNHSPPSSAWMMGVLAGDAASVGAALTYVQQKAAQLGLLLRGCCHWYRVT